MRQIREVRFPPLAEARIVRFRREGRRPLLVVERTTETDPLWTLQRLASRLSLTPMDSYPPSWAFLSQPWLRRELILNLLELASPDPRALWAAKRREGLVVGANQVIHFLFDDNDFGETSIGAMLLSADELDVIDTVKRELDPIINGLPADGDDDSYVTHPRWPRVTAAALTAREAIT